MQIAQNQSILKGRKSLAQLGSVHVRVVTKGHFVPALKSEHRSRTNAGEVLLVARYVERAHQRQVVGHRVPTGQLKETRGAVEAAVGDDGGGQGKVSFRADTRF